MAFEVPIDPQSLKIVRDLLKDSAANAELLAKSVDKVNGSLRSTRTAGDREVALPSNPADRVSTSNHYTGPRDSINPWKGGGSRQNLMVQEEGLRRAMAAGGEDMIRDQRAKVVRAKRRVEADDRLLDPQPKSQQQLWAEMIMTSRILPGGKLSPLVGRAMAAGVDLSSAGGSSGAASTLASMGIGSASKLAPIIASAASAALPLLVSGGLAAAGGAAVFGMAEAGDDRLRKSNGAFYAMGGTPQGAGQAMALGGENASQKALQLGDRLREGTYGAAFMRSRGIVDYGPYQVDKSSNYVASLDALRGIKDVNQRIRVARDVGLTDDLWTTDLSQSSFDRLKNSRAGAGSIDARRDEAEYRATKEEAEGIWDKGVKLVGGAAAQAIVDAKSILWDIPGAISGNKDDIDQAQAAVDSLSRHWNPWYKEDAEKTGAPASGGGGKPGWRNVDRVMSADPETINGTTAGSIPAGWRGASMGSMIRDQAQMLGSFGL